MLLVFLYVAYLLVKALSRPLRRRKRRGSSEPREEKRFEWRRYADKVIGVFVWTLLVALIRKLGLSGVYCLLAPTLVCLPLFSSSLRRRLLNSCVASLPPTALWHLLGEALPAVVDGVLVVLETGLLSRCLVSFVRVEVVGGERWASDLAKSLASLVDRGVEIGVFQNPRRPSRFLVAVYCHRMGLAGYERVVEQAKACAQEFSRIEGIVARPLRQPEDFDSFALVLFAKTPRRVRRGLLEFGNGSVLTLSRLKTPQERWGALAESGGVALLLKKANKGLRFSAALVSLAEEASPSSWRSEECIDEFRALLTLWGFRTCERGFVSGQNLRYDEAVSAIESFLKAVEVCPAQPMDVVDELVSLVLCGKSVAIVGEVGLAKHMLQQVFAELCRRQGVRVVGLDTGGELLEGAQRCVERVLVAELGGLRREELAKHRCIILRARGGLEELKEVLRGFAQESGLVVLGRWCVVSEIGEAPFVALASVDEVLTERRRVWAVVFCRMPGEGELEKFLAAIGVHPKAGERRGICEMLNQIGGSKCVAYFRGHPQPFVADVEVSELITNRLQPTLYVEKPPLELVLKRLAGGSRGG